MEFIITRKIFLKKEDAKRIKLLQKQLPQSRLNKIYRLFFFWDDYFKDFYLMKLDNELIGFAMLSNNNFIDWFIIDEEFRGNGYSKILLNFILEDLRKRNYKKVYLYAVDGSVLYWKKQEFICRDAIWMYKTLL